MDRTKDFSKMTLNICFVYCAKFEIESAFGKVYDDVKKINSGDEDLKESESIEQRVQTTLANSLYVKSQPDILIRTGNDTRLSNFLIMQSTNSELYFLKEKWPELGLWSLAKIILYYNKNYQKICKNQSSIFSPANGSQAQF